MKCINSTVLLLAFVFGLALGSVDAFFDWVYHYEGNDPFLLYSLDDFGGHEIVWRGSLMLLALFFGLIVSYYHNCKKESLSTFHNVFNSVMPICITTNNHDIIMANKRYYKVFGFPEHADRPLKCYDHRPGPICKTDDCPIAKVADSGGSSHYTCESIKKEPGKPDKTFIVEATQFKDAKGKQIGIIESFQDITRRRELEQEKEKLINELNRALAEVKKLSGFLPICASCKKVRDDKGFWKQVESYVAEHSEAEFSHSICPDCASKHYAKLSE